MKKFSRKRIVFGSVNCQSENLGDLVIRKNAIHLLMDGSDQLILYSGGVPQSFIDALDLRARDSLLSSFPRYVFALITKIPFATITLLFSPGPVLINGQVSTMIRGLFLLLLSVMVKMGGGRVVSWGRGYRKSGDGLRSALGYRIELAQKRVSSHFYVRDEISAKLMKCPEKQLPDIAFAFTTSDSTTITNGMRPNLAAISLRDVTQETFSDLGLIQDFCAEVQLPACTVSQVKFDNSINAVVSKKFGWPHYAWNHNSHSTQLLGVEQIYSESLFVVSNRLHALIFGAVQGALPIPVDVKTRDKLYSTLNGVITCYSTSEIQKLLESENGLKLAQSKLQLELETARRQILHEVSSTSSGL